MTVKMRDLSLTGLSFYAEIDLEVEQVFNFRDAALEAIAWWCRGENAASGTPSTRD